MQSRKCNTVNALHCTQVVVVSHAETISKFLVSPQMHEMNQLCTVAQKCIQMHIFFGTILPIRPIFLTSYLITAITHHQ